MVPEGNEFAIKTVKNKLIANLEAQKRNLLKNFNRIKQTNTTAGGQYMPFRKSKSKGY